MTELKYEFVTTEQQTSEINARLQSDEAYLMQLRIDKKEGFFIPEGGTMTSGAAVGGVIPNGGFAPRGTPVRTEAQLDEEIGRVETRIKTLRDYRDNL